MVAAKVVYDFTASGGGEEDLDTQMTLVSRPPSDSRMEFSTDEGTVVAITTSDVIYSCFSGGGEDFCFELPVDEPDADTLKRCIRAGTVAGAFVPVLNGSAFKNKGIQPLLDAVVDFLPSPLDVSAIKGLESDDGEEVTRRSSDDEPFSALAFKIMNDPYVGTLTFVRIYSGVIENGQSTRNTVKGKRERIGRMLEMHANHREDIKEARAGDIVALCGLKNTTTGDTLSDPDHPVVLERMDFPDPVIEVAVEPKTKADQEKMGVALGRLAAEDPSFRVAVDDETGQTLIRGMGELHLEIIVDRTPRRG